MKKLRSKGYDPKTATKVLLKRKKTDDIGEKVKNIKENPLDNLGSNGLS